MLSNTLYDEYAQLEPLNQFFCFSYNFFKINIS